jgi:hypothetical protein
LTRGCIMNFSNVVCCKTISNPLICSIQYNVIFLENSTVVFWGYFLYYHKFARPTTSASTITSSNYTWAILSSVVFQALYLLIGFRVTSFFFCAC